jgi:hypothetical protein
MASVSKAKWHYTEDMLDSFCWTLETLKRTPLPDRLEYFDNLITVRELVTCTAQLHVQCSSKTIRSGKCVSCKYFLALYRKCAVSCPNPQGRMNGLWLCGLCWGSVTTTQLCCSMARAVMGDMEMSEIAMFQQNFTYGVHLNFILLPFVTKYFSSLLFWNHWKNEN